MISHHSTQLSLLSCYVIIQVIYNPYIFSIICKWGISIVLTFAFLKSCICTCQTKKHHFDIQRSRSNLLLGLWWPSNAGRVHRYNTRSKLTYHRPCTHSFDYFSFLLTWDACLVLRDSHTDMNRHLGDTWLLWFFCKVWQLKLLWWMPTSVPPWILIGVLCCGLAMLCSGSHCGINCIFAMGWVVIYHMIVK